MSLIRCPNCRSEFERPKGVQLGTEDPEEIDSGSEIESRRTERDISANVPLLRPNSERRGRGKALGYSGSFEVAWRSYGRKEEKLRAYKEWVVQAPTVGGETRLLQLILTALNWQAPQWAEEGWKFAKYFERYLRARKWEDEPLPVAAPTARTDAAAKAKAEEKRRAYELDARMRGNG